MTSNASFNIILKIIAATMGSVLIIITGSEIYAEVANDPDMSITSRIQDQLEDVEEEPIGCCLPLCNERKETICKQNPDNDWTGKGCGALNECEIGCCFPYGDLTKVACEIVSGRTDLWESGECGEGYFSNPSAKGVKSIARGIGGAWIMTYDLSSCDEDIENSSWSGTWDWDWDAKVEGVKVTDEGDNSIAFALSGGSADFTIGGSPATATISSDDSENMTMTIKFNMDTIGEVEATGSIAKGAEACINPKEL